MGLRTEQMNIDDMLSYFVARNEFSRQSLVEILKNLTTEELEEMKVLNQKDIASFYEELKDKIIWLINKKTTGTQTYNDENLDPESYYFLDFLKVRPLQIILDDRHIEYNPYDDSDQLWEMVYNSNPSSGTTILTENDLSRLEDLNGSKIYENKESILRFYYKLILDGRGITYSPTCSSEELLEYITLSNPLYITSSSTPFIYIDKNFKYDDDFLTKYGLYLCLAARNVDFSPSDDVQTLSDKVLANDRSDGTTNVAPINSHSHYTLDYLKKYGYAYLLKDRGYSSYYEDIEAADLTVMKQKIAETDPTEDTETFLSLSELSQAVDNDPEFYQRVAANTRKVNELTTEMTEFENGFTENVNTLIDGKIAVVNSELNNKLAVIRSDFTGADNNLNTKIENLRTSTTTQYNNLLNTHNTDKTTINNNITNLTNRHNTLEQTVNNHIASSEPRVEYLTNMVNQLIVTTESGKFNVRRGKNKYPSNSGVTTISHNFGRRPDGVFIHTEDNTEGRLGEVWITLDENNLKVSNSGTSQAYFYYTAFVGTQDDSANYIKSGFNTYGGNSNVKKIAHGLGRVPDVVEVIPTAKPNGNLGEYWITVDATYINVYNTGSFTGGLYWCAMIKDVSDDYVSTKTGNFGGTTGGTYNTITIAHGCSKKPLIVSVVPAQQTGKLVGEISVKTDSTNIYITNTGLSTCQFKCYIYDTILSEQTDTFLRYADMGMEDEEGYWDRGNLMPTGEVRLNYSGELVSTKQTTSVENVGYAIHDLTLFESGPAITPSEYYGSLLISSPPVAINEYTVLNINDSGASSTTDYLLIKNITDSWFASNSNRKMKLLGVFASEAGVQLGKSEHNLYLIKSGYAKVKGNFSNARVGTVFFIGDAVCIVSEVHSSTEATILIKE